MAAGRPSRAYPAGQPHSTAWHAPIFLGRPQNPRGYLYFPLTLTVQAQAGPSRGQNCPAGPGRPILFLAGPGRPGPGQKCFSRPFKALPGPPPKKIRCRATQCSCEPHFAPPSSPASHSFPLVFFAFDSTYHPLCLSQILTRFFASFQFARHFSGRLRRFKGSRPGFIPCRQVRQGKNPGTHSGHHEGLVVSNPDPAPPRKTFPRAFFKRVTFALSVE